MAATVQDVLSRGTDEVRLGGREEAVVVEVALLGGRDGPELGAALSRACREAA